jgi:mRNA-degrading endonuclease RelE of RelBE toxin-antitoxin system
MAYRLEIPGHVRRYIRRLEESRQRQIAARLRELATDPYDRSISKQLHGNVAGWRSSDLGNLRILYAADDEVRILAIIDIGPRGDIYKR